MNQAGRMSEFPHDRARDPVTRGHLSEDGRAALLEWLGHDDCVPLGEHEIEVDDRQRDVENEITRRKRVEAERDRLAYALRCIVEGGGYAREDGLTAADVARAALDGEDK